ncbi:MAG TPA: thermonuclease family protein [Tepidisphaeraceae bacterium]|nr:thermonuclease family protein [Tepidisphaeraceae bacterium]
MSDSTTTAARDSGAPDVHPGLRSYLRRRRIVRIAAVVTITFAMVSAGFSHLRAPPDDCARFNHRRFIAIEAIAGDLLRIQTETGDEIVQLLGVAAPRADEHWGESARTYTANRLVGKSVALLLEPPQTRDVDGHLLAYVYPLDVDLINIDIVKDGMAYADRRVTAMLSPHVDLSESEARHKSRGLWKGLTYDAMPAWRRAWLAGQHRAQ